MSVIVKGGGGAAKQEKTVTAGTYVKEVLPDTGKLLSKVVVNPTPTEEKTVTPTTSKQTVSPSEGKHLAKVIVNAMEDVTPEVTAQTPIIEEIIEGLVGKAQGATATADKILEGYSAYVGQQLLQGTFSKDECVEGLKGMFGCTKMAVNKLIVTEDLQPGYDTGALPHSLGVQAKVAILLCKDTPTQVNSVISWIGVDLYNLGMVIYSSIISAADSAKKASGSGGYRAVSGGGNNAWNDETVVLMGSVSYLRAGSEYILITMA